ncbi:MAG: LutB/LldF family L-lactate oxidation iron-sulfur protein [Burkholderiales bacterium]
MEIKSIHFKARSTAQLRDGTLQASLRNAQGRFTEGRVQALAGVDFEKLRDAAAEIRDRVLRNLDLYLEHFERTATNAGACVHWAETSADVNRIVLDIARQHGVRRVIKSKSMVSEECALNDALEAAGLAVVESDLGEYILQLAHEPPSHIVAPVMHKSKDEISDLFARIHQTPRKTAIPELCREAREIMRPHFVAADMGISGANFMIAETGSTLIVTNEGNGRLTTTLPRVHVAISGVEKVVATLEDAATLVRLLPRSATGQSITNYVTINTGTRHVGDHDGPRHFHIILVDAGRANLLGGELQSMLRCIRCGACMNHCPVYQNVGGPAYGWVYPGPMGSVLTPAFVGLENAGDLPNASTFCGECAVVCPVKIPLPDLMRKLREQQVERGLRAKRERVALTVWLALARRPRLYALIAALSAHTLSRLAGKTKLLHWLPFGSGWTKGRDMPAPAGRTFRALYRMREQKKSNVGD